MSSRGIGPLTEKHAKVMNEAVLRLEKHWKVSGVRGGVDIGEGTMSDEDGGQGGRREESESDCEGEHFE
jgi:hypothetical protein